MAEEQYKKKIVGQFVLSKELLGILENLDRSLFVKSMKPAGCWIEQEIGRLYLAYAREK